MRKTHPDSKEKENKKEKSSEKSSGTRSVAQFAVHDHPNTRGQGAPSVISERSDSCELQGSFEALKCKSLSLKLPLVFLELYRDTENVFYFLNNVFSFEPLIG